MENISFEQQENRENPYYESTLIEKVKKSKKIAFLDIDSTLTGNPEVAQQIRAKLEEYSCAVAFVTSRTEEMIMSEEDFKNTNQEELKRTSPHLRKTPEGKFEYADPKSLPDHASFVESDVIAGTTGSRVFIRQKNGGYKLDTEFEKSMKQESEVWRAKVFELLNYIDPNHTLSLAAIDNAENFKSSDVDVYPPNYRVQVEFRMSSQHPESTGSTEAGSSPTEESREMLLTQKQSFMEKLDKLKKDPNIPNNIKETLSNIRITDDSNPEKNRFQLYITPQQGYKARAVEEVMQNISLQTGIERNQLQVIFAGDSYPDVAMGLYSAAGSDATFIIAGGSRLTPVFTEATTTEFAGENFQAIKNRLSGEPEKGILEFDQPLHTKRTIIVGDKAFPGKNAPESVLAALNTIFTEK